ncbi:MAG: hypothetical protein JO034_15930, partial [Singulisphaera sp.]|nr:hypothetical protein [Singulisphaera sp.]
MAAFPLTESQRKGLYKRLRGLLKEGKSRDVIAELKVLAANEADESPRASVNFGRFWQFGQMRTLVDL